MLRSVPSISVLVPFALLASLALAQEERVPAKESATPRKTDKEYFLEGRSLEEKKNYQGAVENFEHAIAINPKEKRYYDNLGFSLAQIYQYDEAIAAFNKAISLDPKDSYAHRELGICYYDKHEADKAVDLLRKSISLKQNDPSSHRWLGFILYQSKQYATAIDSLDEALKLRPDDFDSNYWRGLSLLKLRRFEEADKSLAKAVDIRPNDFNANFWRGICLVRQRNFKDAVSNFERAHQLKPDDQAARVELFGCYLAAGQNDKAARVYPGLLLAIGGGLVFIYCVWLAALLPFSLSKREKMFPGFWFSLAWLGLFLEGQGAFLLILASLPWLGLHETVLMGAIVAGLPILGVALIGFARQPWGEPFRWPPRFGSPKVILISVLLLFGILLIANLFAHLYGYVTNKPFPLQRTIPLIRHALQASPIVAWLGIAFIIPCVEEILFRGLLFAAFQKMWGITGAILASSFLFVLVHLQLIGFLALFLFGVILAWARLRSGSLGLPIALHSLNNAIAMAVLTFAPPLPTS